MKTNKTAKRQESKRAKYQKPEVLCIPCEMEGIIANSIPPAKFNNNNIEEQTTDDFFTPLSLQTTQ